jgi:hypothetical protein
MILQNTDCVQRAAGRSESKHAPGWRGASPPAIQVALAASAARGRASGFPTKFHY